MSHTPGPWDFDDNRPGFVTARGGPDICEVFGESARADECDFNHALIAAAPELLARLKSMVSGAECECDKGDEEHPLCDICWSRQVIAKAEGRSE